MTLEMVLTQQVLNLKRDKKNLLDALERVTSQLEAITNGFDYPHEVLIARVEKAKDLMANMNRCNHEI